MATPKSQNRHGVDCVSGDVLRFDIAVCFGMLVASRIVEMKIKMQKTQATRFWLILILINVAAMVYPLSLYIQADGADARIFTGLIVVGVAFLLTITDAVTLIIAYA